MVGIDEQGLPHNYIELVKNMYKDAKKIVRICEGVMNDFPFTIGLHKGSASSPSLFARVMDELTGQPRMRYHDVCFNTILYW